ncbi:MAG: hypothetical protein AABX12_03830 [Nanoarchaeota archaeon]
MTEQPSDVRPETARKILETAVAGSTFVRTSSNSKKLYLGRASDNFTEVYRLMSEANGLISLFIVYPDSPLDDQGRITQGIKQENIESTMTAYDRYRSIWDKATAKQT